MTLTPEAKKRIDSLTYEELLHKWRFAPVGDATMQGETGEYWGQRIGRTLRAQGADTVKSGRMTKALVIFNRIIWSAVFAAFLVWMATV